MGYDFFYSNLVYNKVIYTITNNLLIGLVPSFADYKLVSISPKMHSLKFSITNKKMQNDNHSAFFNTGLFFKKGSVLFCGIYTLYSAFHDQVSCKWRKY